MLRKFWCCYTLYESRKANISKLEKEVGVKFEHVSAPQPSDIARVAGLDAAEAILRVFDSVIPVFKSAAEDLLNASGLSPVELLAKALTKSIGYIQINQRSLLTSKENYVTLLLDPGRPIYNPFFAYGVLRRFLPEEKVESVRGLALTIDKRCAVFDVAADDLDTYLAAYYVVAEYCLVTAVRDEMNLISYEYFINRQGSDRPDKFLGLDSSTLKKNMLVISEKKSYPKMLGSPLTDTPNKSDVSRLHCRFQLSA
nr:DEAD-box ATP-dependent RNA helicase 7 [Tanacetum cinerariifolium]